MIPVPAEVGESLSIVVLGKSELYFRTLVHQGTPYTIATADDDSLVCDFSTTNHIASTWYYRPRLTHSPMWQGDWSGPSG